MQLCVQGMELEGKKEFAEASRLFNEAWELARTDFEKFTAAHYVARHQPDTAGKLKWDETALQYALATGNDAIKASLPSLYLNIGKCYEDLDDIDSAKTNYEAALSYTNFLPANPYGEMIKTGIAKALERVSPQEFPRN